MFSLDACELQAYFNCCIVFVDTTHLLYGNLSYTAPRALWHVFNTNTTCKCIVYKCVLRHSGCCVESTSAYQYNLQVHDMLRGSGSSWSPRPNINTTCKYMDAGSEIRDVPGVHATHSELGGRALADHRRHFVRIVTQIIKTFTLGPQNCTLPLVLALLFFCFFSSRFPSFGNIR